MSGRKMGMRCGGGRVSELDDATPTGRPPTDSLSVAGSGSAIADAQPDHPGLVAVATFAAHDVEADVLRGVLRAEPVGALTSATDTGGPLSDPAVSGIEADVVRGVPRAESLSVLDPNPDPAHGGELPASIITRTLPSIAAKPTAVPPQNT